MPNSIYIITRYQHWDSYREDCYYKKTIELTIYLNRYVKSAARGISIQNSSVVFSLLSVSGYCIFLIPTVDYEWGDSPHKRCPDQIILYVSNLVAHFFVRISVHLKVPISLWAVHNTVVCSETNDFSWQILVTSYFRRIFSTSLVTSIALCSISCLRYWLLLNCCPQPELNLRILLAF